MPAIDLTQRQLEIARLVADGFTNGEIAAELGISLDTVKRDLSSAMDRVGVPRREALADWYRGSHRAGTRLGGVVPQSWLLLGAGLAVVVVIALIAVTVSGGGAESERSPLRASATASRDPTAASTPAPTSVGLTSPPTGTSVAGPLSVSVDPPLERYLAYAGGGEIDLRSDCSDDARLGGLSSEGTPVQLIAVGIGECREWSLVRSADGQQLWTRSLYVTSHRAPTGVDVPSLAGTAWTIYVGWADDPRVWVPMEVVFLGRGTMNWGTADDEGVGVWEQDGAAIRFVINDFSVWNGTVSSRGRRIEATRSSALDDSGLPPTWFAER